MFVIFFLLEFPTILAPFFVLVVSGKPTRSGQCVLGVTTPCPVAVAVAVAVVVAVAVAVAAIAVAVGRN